MFIVTVICTIIALVSDTVVGIFILTADIVYVILFPQFVCAVFLRFTNAYGSFFGLVIGIILRFGGGEPSLSIRPFIKYPYYSESDGQLFPFKTLAMLCSFITILLVSAIIRELFRRNYIPPQLDISGKVVPKYDVTGVEEAEIDVATQPDNSIPLKYTKNLGYPVGSNEGFQLESSSTLNKF